MTKNKSIYISIPCLDFDSELVKTIQSAIENAKFRDRVYIGIAMMNNKVFYKHVKDFIEINNFNNVKIGYFPSKIFDTVNVGKARNKAASFYNNQDYFLQVDAHTYLNKNWDSFLIESFNDAKAFIKNDKVILSGLPGRYGYYSDSIKTNKLWIDNNNKYPKLLENSFNGGHLFPIPKATDFLPESDNSSDYFKYWISNVSKYIPLSKISAAFIFGDNNFAADRHISDDIIFWEEELLQSIELVANGYSIAFVHKNEAVFHLYSQDMEEDNVSSRTMTTDLAFDINQVFDNMGKNYKKYMDNPDNKEKIAKYIDYSKLDIIENKAGWQGYPTDFSR